MKYDKLVTVFFSSLLGGLLALGAVGSMATAFSLSVGSPGEMALFSFAAAILFSLCFSWKRGGILALLLAAAGVGYLWRLGEFPQQFWQLIYRISHIYDRAYHWGVFCLVDTPWDAGTAQQPMAVLAVILAAAVAWPVCRGRSAAVSVAFSLLPLLSCVVVTDTVPDAKYLYMLILAQVLLTLTSGVRQASGYQGNRLTCLAVLPTALLLGLLFLALPREDYVDPTAGVREKLILWLQNRPAPGGTMVQFQAERLDVPTAAPESVELSHLGPRTDSTAAVFYATAETGGVLYLRGQDYDLYDGQSWEASSTRVEELSYPGVDLGYVVLETQRKEPLLYLPYYPRNGISLIGGKYGNTQLAQHYSFIRQGLPGNWQELAAAGEEGLPPPAPGAGEELRYLSLPESTRRDAQALLAPILAEHTTTASRAQAIASYVQNSAAYDKNPSIMPQDAGDFALWFLQSGERGYCVHFATAAAVLLRAAGIEARYVSGYMRSLQPGQSEAFTGEHAHAWVEYYEPGLNAWIPLEATPGEGLPGLGEDPSALPTAPTQEPSASPTQGENTEAPTVTVPETQPAAIPSQPGSQEPPPEPESPAWWKGLFSLMVPLLFLLFMEAQRQLRLLLGKMSRHMGSPNSQALKRWGETERLAARLGEAPPESLKFLALKAKFSQHTLTEEELAQFAAYRQSAQGRLQARPWYWQLAYRYLFALY